MLTYLSGIFIVLHSLVPHVHADGGTFDLSDYFPDSVLFELLSSISDYHEDENLDQITFSSDIQNIDSSNKIFPTGSGIFISEDTKSLSKLVSCIICENTFSKFEHNHTVYFRGPPSQ